jgi:hypothetical protein
LLRHAGLSGFQRAPVDVALGLASRLASNIRPLERHGPSSGHTETSALNKPEIFIGNCTPMTR